MTELRKEVRAASEEVKELLAKDVIKRINRLPFKTNKVPLVGGNKTTDADRAQDLVNSIEARVNNYVDSQSIKDSLKGGMSYKATMGTEKMAIPITITAMGKYYKNSHIGWYYEYGTGTKEVIPFAGYWNTDAVNPMRGGHKSEIVSRPAGVWKDAGGNIRRSKGKGGVRNEAFIKNVGEDVEAHRWFYKAFKENQGKVLSVYSKHIKKVDYRKYVHAKSKIVLGGSRRG